MSMRTILTGAALSVTAGLAMMLTTATGADSQGKVLRHIVLYKFKDDLRPEQVQEVVDAFAALPKKTGLILKLEYGTNVSPENKSEGLTHAFVVTFRGEKERDAYLVHPAHDEYVKVVRDRREKVVVFDFWADG